MISSTYRRYKTIRDVDDIICCFAREKDADEFFTFLKFSSSEHKVHFRKKKG